MLTDIEIANATNMQKINEVAKKISITEENIENFGKYKAKIDVKVTKKSEQSKLILVTAINPTPYGEGKTTTTIGLIDSLSTLGHNTIGALREPSLGPVFGMKGGACGGGYAQVVPMQDINLHFTGDLHAIGTANNLLCAMIDNHIKWGNELNIDASTIAIRRSLDMNERQLRYITSGLGGEVNGIPRDDGFDITVASEVMATFCLAKDIFDLKEKLGNIIIGYSFENKPITAREIGANGAMTALLKDAIKPNLVQTLEGNPVLIHGGPFANIAHGCNSLIATNVARELGDFVVTEAGFGADLGAEKFLNIKCQKTGIIPSVVVIVATIRAIKHNGDGILENGICNLEKHIKNIRNNFGQNVIVAVNKFNDDTQNELDFVTNFCDKLDVQSSICTSFAEGSKGGIDLAQKVVEISKTQSEKINFTYEITDNIQEKIEKICTKIYGAKSVIFLPKAEKMLTKINDLQLNNLPVCMAKTQYSFTDDAKKLGCPRDFEITIKDITISAGAGFVVAMAGNIIKMPGLPKKPSAIDIDIDQDGNIIGLF